MSTPGEKSEFKKAHNPPTTEAENIIAIEATTRRKNKISKQIINQNSMLKRKLILRMCTNPVRNLRSKISRQTLIQQ
jgi:hypothetical protein